jgi:hypothetical protein
VNESLVTLVIGPSDLDAVRRVRFFGAVCFSFLAGAVLGARFMELRRLEYFVAVAKEANFTRAANKMHVAQPGVERMVMKSAFGLHFSAGGCRTRLRR